MLLCDLRNKCLLMRMLNQCTINHKRSLDLKECFMFVLSLASIWGSCKVGSYIIRCLLKCRSNSLLDAELLYRVFFLLTISTA